MDVPPSLDPDDVLRQPTRARLFALLRELARPVATEELAARLGLHRSGIRVHLERLRVAGLVDRHRLRRPRGRPQDGWSISADADPGGEPPRAYGELAAWLATAIPAQPERLSEVEAAGRRVGRELSAASPLPLEQRLRAVFAALGFKPRSQSATPGRICFALGNCPYRAAVRGCPDRRGT
jgi:predicted ArsR family transcriptional regulator